MDERIEQIKAAFADDMFVRDCIEAENEAAVQKLLADKGIEMSLPEIGYLKEVVCAVSDGKLTAEQLDRLAHCGELSDDELEQAAGGGAFDWMFNYTLGGAPCSAEDYNVLHTVFSGMTKELNGKGIATVAVIGVAAVGAAGVAAYAYRNEIADGVTSAYGYVSENITRW